MENKKVVYKNRVSKSQKTKEWHIAKAREISTDSNYSSNYKKNKINYDAVNGILNQENFEHITKPHGFSSGDLADEMHNFPILTSHFKYLEGEMLKRPDNTRIFTTNPEAVQENNKKKGELTSMYVVNEIKKARMEEALKSNPDLQEKEIAKMEQEVMSPEEIADYMRDYRDSYETMAQEIYNHLKEDQFLKEKDRTAWKHGLTSAFEIYYTGIVNKKPIGKVVNPLRFSCDMDSDLMFIHEGEWATTYDYMSPSRVVSMFPNLTKSEIDRIYEGSSRGGGARTRIDDKWEIESDVDQNDWFSLDTDGSPATTSNKSKVMHHVWRDWYKVGFLTYMDEDEGIQVMRVPEGYSVNEERGDLSIKWEWYPEIRQITEINDDIWTDWGAVDKFYDNEDDPYDCPLPYTGVIHNNLNSQPVGPVDLMLPFQYFANIVFRLIQRDIASDKGKKLLANINQIPTSMGIDLDKWQHYLNVDDIIWINPNEEGNRGNNDMTSWRSVDMTAAASIDKKVQLLEYIDAQCGKVIGMNDARTGQQGNRELVGTTQQQIVQSNYTTEPWFATHELGKKAFVTQLLNVAKFAYHKYGTENLTYILSDLSKKIIELDLEKLPLARIGAYISSSSEDMRMYNELKQLAHAALQNQSATLSSIAKMIRGNATPGELIDTLEGGEMKMQQMQAQGAQAEREANAENEKNKLELENTKLQMEKYKADLVAETARYVAEVGSFKFAETQDSDGNGIPDQLEVDKFLADSEIRMKELDMKSDEINKKLGIETEKNRLKEKEIESKERTEKLKAKTALKNKVSGEK
jgi:hypothetical protein